MYCSLHATAPKLSRVTAYLTRRLMTLELAHAKVVAALTLCVKALDPKQSWDAGLAETAFQQARQALARAEGRG